jgi:chemotaxis protein methyltransferase CheR
MTAAAAAPRALSLAVGIELSAYRDNHVAERIRRAVEREGVADVSELVDLLRASRAARTRFRRSLAVSVSGMFRDPTQFDLLEHVVLPPLLDRRGRLRVWSAGCADGSELYSVGLLLERLGALGRSFLLGSDLLEENVETARRGSYGDVELSDRLRAAVRWERRDVIREGAPRGAWDLVLCRNVGIYLTPPAKRRLHEAVAGALGRRGVLLLGRSEAIGEPARLELERMAPNAYRRRS